MKSGGMKNCVQYLLLQCVWLRLEVYVEAEYDKRRNEVPYAPQPDSPYRKNKEEIVEVGDGSYRVQRGKIQKGAPRVGGRNGVSEQNVVEEDYRRENGYEEEYNIVPRAFHPAGQLFDPHEQGHRAAEEDGHGGRVCE